MTMLMVNIADAKARLSEYVEAVTRGERVVICNRNKPVAELRAVEEAATGPRDLSPMFPDWQIDPAFYEPLPAEEIALWEDGDPSKVGHHLRVAEERASDGSEPKPRRRRK
jgi:prevent-host-death family protein